MNRDPFLSQKVLQWYDIHKRDLPWRSVPLHPYPIWISEIMLQQTTVPTVIPYFKRFLERWPTVEHLAAADQGDVLVEWQGLGYYRRARYMHQCAQIICTQYGGIFPSSPKTLRKLPGIGPYTSGAIAAIAFQKPGLVVDGNILRILSRFFAIPTPYPHSKPDVEKYALALIPEDRPGDYIQALMDLGSSVCKPQTPVCLSCPLSSRCQAFQLGIPSSFPLKLAKPPKPARYTVAFLVQDSWGRILLKKRPEKGLLGGMMEVPSSPWSEKETPPSENLHYSPIPIPSSFSFSFARISHIFTHFHLHVNVLSLTVSPTPENQEMGVWVFPHELAQYALPTVMKKVIQEGLKKATSPMRKPEDTRC